jgi:hypothetical protein
VSYNCTSRYYRQLSNGNWQYLRGYTATQSPVHTFNINNNVYYYNNSSSFDLGTLPLVTMGAPAKGTSTLSYTYNYVYNKSVNSFFNLDNTYIEYNNQKYGGGNNTLTPNGRHGCILIQYYDPDEYIPEEVYTKHIGIKLDNIIPTISQVYTNNPLTFIYELEFIDENNNIIPYTVNTTLINTNGSITNWNDNASGHNQLHNSDKQQTLNKGLLLYGTGNKEFMISFSAFKKIKQIRMWTGVPEDLLNEDSSEELRNSGYPGRVRFYKYLSMDSNGYQIAQGNASSINPPNPTSTYSYSEKIEWVEFARMSFNHPTTINNPKVINMDDPYHQFILD